MTQPAYERILNGALSMYSKYGIKSITMDDLASEMGVSKKTLYQHVQDKNELIRKVIDHEIDLQKSAMQQMKLASLSAIEELLHVNQQIHKMQSIHSPTFYFDLKKYYPEVYNYWIEYKRHRLYEMIIQNLEKGINEGYYRKDFDPHIIGRLHVARVEMMHNSEFLTDEDVNAEQFIDEVFRYHIHGICNERGLEHFRNLSSKIENITKS